MKEIALAALLAAVILTAQQPPASISVSGIVISSTSGDPVRKAEVLLRAKDEAKGNSYQAESDANGRFLFQDVRSRRLFNFRRTPGLHVRIWGRHRRASAKH